MPAAISLADMAARTGQDIGTSRWFTVDQAMIDGFADVTHDHQFIHVDPAAAAQTPFGGTIAHGFLTLSLLSAMVYDAVPPIEGVTMGVNYGFDRVRFVSPVKVDARVRGHFTLAACDRLRRKRCNWHWMPASRSKAPTSRRWWRAGWGAGISVMRNDSHRHTLCRHAAVARGRTPHAPGRQSPHAGITTGTTGPRNETGKDQTNA